MDDELKKLLLKKAESHAVQGLDDAIEIAELYVESTESGIDDLVLEGLKKLKGLVIDALDKIDGEDNR